MASETLTLEWNGPFGWPGINFDLDPVPNSKGVYLFTVEYPDGYLIYAAGLTRRPYPLRLREHTRSYLSGIYNILDIEAMKKGARLTIWDGFWTAPRTAQKESEFQLRHDEIVAAARKQMNGFRLFVTDLSVEPRIL